MEQRPAERNLVRLLEAMNEVLRILSSDGGQDEALRVSFVAAAEGFAASKALLLRVESADPLRLRAVHVRGRLGEAQIEACERGESVEGVSPSVLRRVVASGRAEAIEDPRHAASVTGTASLEGQDFSVLCAPIRNPLQARVLAVLYLQHSRVRDPYAALDLLWLQGYADALGRAFGWHWDGLRAEREAEERMRTSDVDAPDILGGSASTRALRRELHRVHIPQMEAPNPDPVLLLGERGTGKDLVARYLHAYSRRAGRPFVAVSGGEIGDDLAASRFFGHKRGAFTGAQTDERGLFRSAEGGVLFLDEVADLSARAQACLLRVLENHAVVPVGESREVPVDVAVVLATNRDLEAAVKAGTLRSDFYDRFRVQSVRLVPLRERPQDVPELLEHFRRWHERRMRRKTLGFTSEAASLLAAYPWPGNVREVARVCSALVSRAAPGALIDRDLLAQAYTPVLEAAPTPAGPAGPGASLAEAVRAFKRGLILERLEAFQGNVAAARQSLKLKKSTFHRYARELALPGPRRKRPPSPR
jgi:sigma-54-specific transcriptional regulator